MTSRLSLPLILISSLTGPFAVAKPPCAYTSATEPTEPKPAEKWCVSETRRDDGDVVRRTVRKYGEHGIIEATTFDRGSTRWTYCR